MGDDAFEMFRETELDPIDDRPWPEGGYAWTERLAEETMTEGERRYPNPLTDQSLWTLPPALGELRFRSSAEVLGSIRDDGLKLRLKRLAGIEHLGVYASSWPGYVGRHSLDHDRFSTICLTTIGWSSWFRYIERRAETDPDGFPGKHATPPERGAWALRRTFRVFSEIGVFG